MHLEGIARALSYGGATHSLSDVLDQIERGDAQLWLDDSALIVTEVHDTPRLRELRFWIATGELQAVVDLSERVLDWGRAMGCKRAVLTGRKGWVKALAGEGWKQEMVVMGRAL